MAAFLEILKYILPSGVVFLTVFYILKKYFAEERSKRDYEYRMHIEKMSYPIKLQAYERLSLFLERIRIHNLILRLQNKDMDSKVFVHALMMGITHEFEHNLVQQIYVSDKLWEIILFAKNEVVHSLHEASNLPNNSFEETKTYLYQEAIPKTDPVIDKALQAIKKELELIL